MSRQQRHRVTVTALALLFSLACAVLPMSRAQAKGSLSKVEGEFERAIRKVTPATVVCLPQDVDPKLVPQASSGVIVSKKGYVLSDGDVGMWLDVPAGERPARKHLRHKDMVEIRIVDPKGRGFKSYPAKVIRRSRELDTTLLKMEKPPGGLKYLSAGNSDELRVGDFGFVMGNSFGLAQEAAPTLTAGIVASLVPLDLEKAKFGKGGAYRHLYTSAAVNPGVNGGPFVDVDGQLVGTISSSVLFAGKKEDDPELAYSYLGKIVPIERLKAHYRDLPDFEDVFSTKNSRSSRKTESDQLATAFHYTGAKAYRSVVSLTLKRKTPLGLVEPRRGGPPVKIPRYLGPVSGVLVSEDGFILTSLYNLANIATLQIPNWPAPQNARVKPAVDAIESVTAHLADGRAVQAKVVSYHEGIGLALIKADMGPAKEEDSGSASSGASPTPIDLPTPVHAERYASGNFVLAVGNPFGAERLPDPLLTVGVLSKQHAEKAVQRWAYQWQTDAGVTDGNCGGAAVDIHGHLYGILTIWTSTQHGRNSGIGFIIPWPQIEPVLGEMKRGRSFRLPYFGIGWKRIGDMDTTILSAVAKDAPAAKAGLKPGDEILAIDGEAVKTPKDVAGRIFGKWCDDELLLRVNRGGETLELKLKLGARP